MIGHSGKKSGRVQSQGGITLVGAGEVDRESLEEALKYAPTLVAADGGANRAIAAGLRPIAVIGDLDSLGTSVRDELGPEAIVEVSEQETTDFEKCLERIDATFVLAVGFAGGRLDHTLATMSVLARRVGPPTIVLGKDDIVFALPRRLAVNVPIGQRVSLFPIAAVSGRSEGLQWPIDGLSLAPDGRIGTSNRVVGPVAIETDRDGLLALMPRAALRAVLAALIG